jgi:shikimate dehydrogenase
MNMKITGKTKVLGIIGYPVEHSLSPLMQNAAISALRLDYIYVPFLVEPSYLSTAVNGLRSLGIQGFNVTLPHKSAIIPLLDKVSPEAELSGAVNTVNRERGLLVGYNTDGTGLLKSLEDDLHFDPRGATVLVLGAGGAARGGVAALCRAGVARIIVANRTMGKGEALADIFRARFNNVELALSSLEKCELSEYLRETDLLINTTSVGMNGSSFAGIDLEIMRSDAMVYDMVYSPPETPLLAAAKKRKLPCANGLGMLAAQGEAAFSIWTGLESPSGLMKMKLLESIKE